MSRSVKNLPGDIKDSARRAFSSYIDSHLDLKRSFDMTKTAAPSTPAPIDSIVVVADAGIAVMPVITSCARPNE